MVLGKTFLNVFQTVTSIQELFQKWNGWAQSKIKIRETIQIDTYFGYRIQFSWVRDN